jgi:hypothetical protein
MERYYLFVKVKITILIIVSVFSSLSFSQEPYRTLATIFLVVLLVVSILIAVITNIVTKYDHVWFNCRAVAESVKTETWFFMMRMNIYGSFITNLEAVNRFIDSLRDILQLRPVARYEIASISKEGEQVTKFMIDTRGSGFQWRKDVYIVERIKEQQKWFHERSEANHLSETQWLYTSWILQFIAVGIAIFMVYFAIPFINPVGVITTAAASATSWMHSKSFSELSQTFSMISHELSLLEAKANQVENEEELANIVLDTERIISREHSILISRRLGIQPV